MKHVGFILQASFTILGLYPIQCSDIQNTSFITKFLEHIGNSNIRPLFETTFKPIFRSINGLSIEQVIKNKIIELKPVLEDDDYKLNFDELEDTKILDKPVIERHGQTESTKEIPLVKLKKRVDKAMNKETVSKKTKMLVAKTLDELIARAVGNQCRWKTMDTAEKIFRIGKNDLESFFRAHNFTVQGWDKLQNFLAKLLTNRPVKPSVLFTEVQRFFEEIIKETKHTDKNYEIKCQLVEYKDTDRKILRERDSFKEREKESECRYFQICSKELQRNLLNTYNTINTTVVNTITNYAAMYDKDVNNEDKTRNETVCKVLKEFSKKVDKKIHTIYIKEIENLRLDKNKLKKENIKIMKSFISKTIGRTKSHIQKHVLKYLQPIQVNPIILTIKKDLEVNFNADLKNLENVLIAKVCSEFSTCNENTRRQNTEDYFEPKNKNVYVKVELALKEDKNKTINYRKRIDFKNDKNYFEGFKNIKVTRTTTGIAKGLRDSITTEKVAI